MSINSITYNNSNIEMLTKEINNKETKEPKESNKVSTQSNTDKVELSDPKEIKRIYKQDVTAVKKAIAEVEAKYSNLQNMVNTLFKNQANNAIYADWDWLVQNGRLGDALKNITVDEKTKAQAQKDISEDGYWGVNKTSERILDFAKALTGGDPSKADKMLEAFKKGYKQAVGAFGGKEENMPDISRQTYDAVIKGFNEWKNSEKTDDQLMQDTVFDQITGQGAVSGIVK